MANKALVLGAATVGGVMLYSGLAGVNVMDVLAGKASLKDADPKGGKGLPEELLSMLGKAPGSVNTLVPPGKLGDVSGKTPREIINDEVLPLARKYGMVTGRNSAMVDAANAVHGATVSGGRSDHQGPPDDAWAADMSNGQNPTPGMDKLAVALSKKFRIPGNIMAGGIHNATWGGFRYQLIYRCGDCGGNHMNHVHFGVRRA